MKRGDIEKHLWQTLGRFISEEAATYVRTHKSILEEYNSMVSEHIEACHREIERRGGITPALKKSGEMDEVTKEPVFEFRVALERLCENANQHLHWTNIVALLEERVRAERDKARSECPAAPRWRKPEPFWHHAESP